MYIDIENRGVEYNPCPDDGTDWGKIDFRLEIHEVSEEQFKALSLLLTESIATAVSLFQRTYMAAKDGA